MNREPIYNSKGQHCGFMGAKWSNLGIDAWRLAIVRKVTAEDLQDLYGLEWGDYIKYLEDA